MRSARTLGPTAAVLAVCLLAACASLSMKEDVYATLDEARADGAIARGFVPDGLPPGVSDLRVGHVDSGVWGTFSFPASAVETVRSLVGEELVSNQAAVDPPGRLEWWPPLLRTTADPVSVRTTGLRVYRARRGPLTYAIHWSDGRAYYWKR